MELASYLVQGVDVWLNTPNPETEASGTSGMKAVMNGVLNFSMPDGWWAEAEQEDTGWTLPSGQASGYRDESDADALYTILEKQVIPAFSNGMPKACPRDG